MAKTKISEFSTTPGNNTDINGINIAEGCAPSGINNAIRELMSDLKEWQSGAMDVYVIPQGTIASPGLQLYGDLDTGFYGDAANQLGVAVGGSSVGYFSASGWVGNVVAQTIDLVNIEVTNIKAKDGTTSISLADSTGIATFSKATVIETTDNTNAALRITQLGTGNALLVEDATNPDTTPTVIDQFGNVILGTTTRTTPITSKVEIHSTSTDGAGLTPSLGFYNWSATATTASALTFRHYPSGTVGTLAANTSGDVLGRIVFLSYDGTNAFGAVIRGVSGAGGTAPSITYDASGGHNFTSGPIDVENLEVTNIKARDGTAAASIADSTGAITVTKDLTANGVTLGKGLGSVLTNTALGRSALAANTVGDLNTAVGNLSLTSNTGGTGNTAVGHVAMTSHQGGSLNTAVGAGSLTANLNGNNNTAIGQSALGTATGSNNTAVGSASGSLITTGNKNTIIGNYTGNQGGLDIRTSSNYIVLSDGDGNPRAYWNGADATFGGALTATTITGTQVNGDNLRLDGNTLSSTDTNGNIVVAPNGTGITTFSNYLKTGNLEVGQAALGTNLIKATNTNGGIYLQTNGTGLIFADAASIIAGNASATTKITTNGASDLVLDTNDGSNSGSITIQDGVNGNIVIAPNGTGQVQLSGALDVTDIEVTNIKAKDGTAALSIADSTGAVTVATALTANGGAVFNENGADVDFRVEGDTDANLIFADASTDRVGIGTNAPATKVEISGSHVSLRGLLSLNSAAANISAQTFYINNTYKGAVFADTSDNFNISNITASGALIFNAGSGTERMRLDSSGNLGIGTSSPAAILATSKSSSTQATGLLLRNPDGTTGSSISIDFEASTGTSGSEAALAGRISGVRVGSGTTGALDFFTTNSGTLGSAKMRLDSSGNLGIGVTPSSWQSGVKAIQIGARGFINNSADSTAVNVGNNCYYSGTNWIYQQNATASIYQQYSGLHAWLTAASGTAGNTISFTQAMTLDASGRLGIGQTTLVEALTVKTQNASTFINIQTSSDSGVYVGNNGGAMILSAGNSERARITSGGYFKASNTGSYVGSTGAYHELVSNDASNGIAVVESTNASYTSYALFVGAARNTTNNSFYAIGYYNRGAAAYKFRVADSGDVTNTNGTYGTISDAKMKTDIVDAGSQWSDIKALRFRKFKMKDDPSGLVQLGVVAQEVEQTSPGLVDEHADKDAEGNDLGTTTKSVKTSVLLMKAAVALQEAMARIEKLEAEVAALKGV